MAARGEFAGEGLESGREGAVDGEIIDRTDEGFAEEDRPGPVDCGAGEWGIVRMGDPAGELLATGAVFAKKIGTIRHHRRYFYNGFRRPCLGHRECP